MNPQAAVTALLADGTEVVLRPIGPEDKPLLEQGMAMLSPNSRRLRFMSPIERLSRSQLVYLTEIDHERHVAWGAMVGDEPVAVGRVVRLPGPQPKAEIAITVLDQWQGRGLGKVLVRLLAEIARSVGIEKFVFEALPENDRIVRLLKGFGGKYILDEGVVTGSLDIASIDPVSIERGNLLQLAASVRRPAESSHTHESTHDWSTQGGGAGGPPSSSRKRRSTKSA